MKMLHLIARYYRTVSYLRWSQIRTRIFRKLLTELERLPLLKAAYAKPFKGANVTPLSLPRLPLPDKHRLNDGNFFYIGKTFNCSTTWFPEGASLLWLFNLHYFDFLTELSDPHEKKQAILDWIAEVPVLHPAAWHPFPSSLRICNWIAELPSFDSELTPEERDLIRSSIYNQLRHIRWQLEEDLLANHLIENCRALIVGGVFLRQQDLIARGLKVLLRELPEQILKDGGHYERSPQYHTAVLLALLDIYQALTQSGREVPPILPAKCRLMTEFLAKVLDNNKLPLLNDTSPEFVPEPVSVIELAAKVLGIPVPTYPELYEYLEDTGLFIVRTPRMALTFDVGPIGPDVQPGHAHSDTLSVLLTIDGVPILTDSGVYTYEPGPERDYFRSAFAHNGPIINGEDPNEMWGAFRVGRRVGRAQFRVIKDGKADGTGEWEVEGRSGRVSRCILFSNGCLLTIADSSERDEFLARIFLGEEVGFQLSDANSCGSDELKVRVKCGDGVCAGFDTSPVFGVKRNTVAVTLHSRQTKVFLELDRGIPAVFESNKISLDICFCD
jgi:uncharacterized heparinase superfamily protein